MKIKGFKEETGRITVEFVDSGVGLPNPHLDV
jgi:hypothetical protein